MYFETSEIEIEFVIKPVFYEASDYVLDEEGGQVSRVGANAAMGVTHLPAAATYGEAGDMAGVYDGGSALAAELARDAKCGRLVITHLNPLFSPQTLLEEARAVFPETCLAQAGKILSL